MVRFPKIFILLTVFSVFSCSFTFSQESKSVQEKHFRMPNGNQNVIVGQVKSVDEKTSIIKIENADGKEIEIKITPFSMITIDPKLKTEDSTNKEYSIKDIKINSWIMVSTFKTDTKVLDAAQVLIK